MTISVRGEVSEACVVVEFCKLREAARADAEGTKPGSSRLCVNVVCPFLVVMMTTDMQTEYACK